LQLRRAFALGVAWRIYAGADVLIVLELACW
jgi:hypothetical protein